MAAKTAPPAVIVSKVGFKSSLFTTIFSLFHGSGATASYAASSKISEAGSRKSRFDSRGGFPARALRSSSSFGMITM